MEYQTKRTLQIIKLNSELDRSIKLACEGNRQAQKVLYQRFAPKLLSVCRQYIEDIYVAEDLLVSAFLKIFCHLHTYDQRGSFDAWIRRITVNECISYIRATKKVRFEHVDQYLVASDDADSHILTDDIQKMIDHLPDGCKMVFNLYAVEGYKHQEIAEKLQISEGTSKSQLSYARRLLQQWVKQSNMEHHG